MKYLIKVSPVTEQIPVVRETYLRILSSDSMSKVPDLIRNGGILVDNLTKQQATKVASDLRGLFVAYEVIEMESNYPGPEPDPQDPEIPSENRDFSVFGRVLLANSQPVEGCTVRIFDRDLRSEQFLGETMTDRQGSYKIQYSQEQFKRAEKGTGDIIVRLYNSVGKLFLESDIIFNVSLEERIDLTVPESAPLQPSEYEQLVALITPLLENVPLSELTSDDVLFLTNETGRSFEEITFVKDDAVLALRTGMPAGVFYGLARVQVAYVNPGEPEQAPVGHLSKPFIDLSMIMEEPTQKILSFLDTAIARQFAPVELRSQREKIEKLFTEFG